jgi:hypothetical protein
MGQSAGLGHDPSQIDLDFGLAFALICFPIWFVRDFCAPSRPRLRLAAKQPSLFVFAGYYYYYYYYY